MPKKILPVITSVLGSALLLTAVFLLLGDGHAEARFSAIETIARQDTDIRLLSPGYSQYADPGSAVTYTHVLTNPGPLTDTFRLEAANSRGWMVTLNGAAVLSLTVPGGNMTATFAVRATIPLTVPAPITATTLISAFSDDPPVSDMITDTTIVSKAAHCAYLPLAVRGYVPDWGRGGLAGHTVYQIAVCAADPQRLYAGTEAGIFRSTDGGASWQPAGLPGVLVRGLDVAANDCSHVYAATWGQHVQHSTNSGSSWSPLSAGLPESFLYTVVADPSSTRLYAGTSTQGVYQFSGIGWQRIFYQSNAGTIPRLNLPVSNTLLVATWGGKAYRLTFITGITWSPNLLSVPDNNVFEVVQGSGNVLFAATENRLYRTTGITWETVYDTRTYGVAIDPDLPQVVYAATSEGAWLSINGGGHFDRFGLEGLAVRHIAPGPPHSTLLHAGTADGAWRRTRPVSIVQRR